MQEICRVSSWPQIRPTLFVHFGRRLVELGDPQIRIAETGPFEIHISELGLLKTGLAETYIAEN